MISKLCHVVPVAQKADVASVVKKHIALWENQSGKCLKAVRTERGTEYLNKELEAYFSSKGVIHNTTALYTPEQNGVAEGLNRTLMERLGAMLYEKVGRRRPSDTPGHRWSAIHTLATIYCPLVITTLRYSYKTLHSLVQQ